MMTYKPGVDFAACLTYSTSREECCYLPHGHGGLCSFDREPAPDVLKYAPMWNGCGGCNFTRRASIDGSRYCSWCVKAASEALARLAENLKIAAALCEAWRLYPCDWRPGCGRSAP